MAETPDPSDAPNINPIIHEMFLQNERGAAITGGVYLESELERAIIEQWPPLSATQREKLFTGYGPLASFSAKILLGHSMGLLAKLAKSDCDQIKWIRNRAAHLGTPFSFSDREVAHRINAINCVRHFDPMINEGDFGFSKQRIQYMDAVRLISAYLFFQRHWKEKFGPKAVLPDWDSKPAKSAQ